MNNPMREITSCLSRATFALAILISISAVQGAISTWTNRANGNFTWATATQWSPNGAPASASTTTLDFLSGTPALGNVTINATNNLASPFNLNALVLGGTAPTNGSAATGNLNIYGNQLRFVTDGAKDPAIVLNMAKPGGSNINYTINAPVALPTTLTVRGDGSNSVTIAGQVTGVGGIIKTNGSTTTVLTLSGSNTFEGPITINAGQVTAGNDFALGTTNSPTIVNAGGQVQFAGRTVSEPFTIAGTGWNATEGALRVGGGARTTLNGPITLSSNALLKADGGAAFTINGDITATTSGDLAYRNDNSSAATIIAGKISLGTGRLFKDLGTGALRLDHPGNSWSGGTYITAGTLQIGAGTTGSMGTGNITNNGTLNISVAEDFIINDLIAGTGGVTKGGANTNALILNANNQFTGAVVVNNGSIVVKNSGSLGVGPKSIQVANGTAGNSHLRLDGSGGDINLAADLSFRTSWVDGTVYNDAGNNTISGNFYLIAGGGDTTIVSAGGLLTLGGILAPENSAGRQLRLGGASNGRVTGFINNDVSGLTNLAALIKQDSGTWTLESANNYRGATRVEGGRLALGSGGSISNSASIFVGSNAFFDVSAVSSYALTLQPLSGYGAVVGTLTAPGGSSIIPGVRVGFGALTFSNLILQGTTLEFDLGATSTPGAGSNDLITVVGDLNLAGGASVVFNFPDGGPTPGTYTLIKYQGTLTGPASSLVPTVPWAGGVTFSDAVAGEIRVTFGPVTDGPLVWQGDFIFNNWDINASFNWTNDTGTAVKFLEGNAVVFNDTSVNTTLYLNYSVSPSSVTVDSSLAYTLAGSGEISSGATFTKRGTGSFDIQTANDYTGPTVVEAGDLYVKTATALGSTVRGTTVTGGRLRTLGAFNLPEPITLAGGLLQHSGAGTVNLDGVLTLATNSALLVDSGSTFNIRSVLGTSGYDLTLPGPGVTVLSVTNAYDGTITVSNGTLRVASDLALGSTNKPTIIRAGGQLQAQSLRTIDEPITLDTASTNVQAVNVGGNTNFNLNGPVTVVSDAKWKADAGSRFTVNGPVTGTNAVVRFDLDGSGAASIVNGRLSLGAGSLVKAGAAALTLLAANNTWTGPTVLVGGTAPSLGALQIGNGGANGSIGSGPVELGTNTTLQVNSSLTLTINSPITGTGTLLKQGSGTLILAATNTFGTGGSFNFTSGTSGNFGAIRLASPYALVGHTNINLPGNNGGYGTIEILGNQTYTNHITTAGRNVGTPPALRNVSGTNLWLGNLSINNSGGSYWIESAGGLLNLAGLVQNALTGATRTWTLIGAGNGLISGSVVNGPSTALTGLTMSGSGNWTLTGTNPYTGSTAVTAGRLFVNGTNSGTAAYTVSGGFLAGSGVVAGPVTVQAGGALAPGGSVGAIGQLTISNSLTLGGNLQVDLNKSSSPASDLLVVTGVLTNSGAGTVTVTRTGPGLVIGDTFTLFSKPVLNGGALSISPVPGSGLAWSNSLAIDGAITVVRGINLAKTNLQYQVSGSTLEISWPADKLGMTLQAQTNALSVGYSTNWAAVPGSTTTNRVIQPLNPANGTVFYRLVY